MKTLKIELDDALAAKLEHAAPRSRMRSKFVRNAIWQAIWNIEEAETALAYERQRDSVENAYFNPRVWEKKSRP